MQWRVAVGTRYGEIYLLDGIDEKKPNPLYHLYATGLDEIFGLAYKDGAFYVTQSCELTRVTDSKHDGHADRFETISVPGSHYSIMAPPVVSELAKKLKAALSIKPSARAIAAE